MEGYVVLDLDPSAPVLSAEDSDKGLFILDATWRYATAMGKATLPFLAGTLRRSLPPGLRTAYPRRQDDCPDPGRGLASLEALYASYLLMRRDTAGLLDCYYWKDAFLRTNSTMFTGWAQAIPNIEICRPAL